MICPPLPFTFACYIQTGRRYTSYRLLESFYCTYSNIMCCCQLDISLQLPPVSSTRVCEEVQEEEKLVRL